MTSIGIAIGAEGFRKIGSSLKYESVALDNETLSRGSNQLPQGIASRFRIEIIGKNTLIKKGENERKRMGREVNGGQSRRIEEGICVRTL